MNDTKPHASLAIDDMAGIETALRHAEAQIAEWAAARDQLRQLLIERLGDADTGTINGRPAVRISSYVERRVSAARVRELAPPALVDACTVETVRQRFRLVDPDSGGQS